MLAKDVSLSWHYPVIMAYSKGEPLVWYALVKHGPKWCRFSSQLAYTFKQHPKWMRFNCLLSHHLDSPLNCHWPDRHAVARRCTRRIGERLSAVARVLLHRFSACSTGSEQGNIRQNLGLNAVIFQIVQFQHRVAPHSGKQLGNVPVLFAQVVRTSPQLPICHAALRIVGRSDLIARLAPWICAGASSGSGAAGASVSAWRCRNRQRAQINHNMASKVSTFITDVYLVNSK